MVSSFEATVLVNFGTGRRRLRKTREAWSSKLPPAAHSMRISCLVSTVNRAWPRLTMAVGSATGLSTCAGLAGVSAELETPLMSAIPTNPQPIKKSHRAQEDIVGNSLLLFVRRDNLIHGVSSQTPGAEVN